MTNPFELLDKRLNHIQSIVTDIKRETVAPKVEVPDSLVDKSEAKHVLGCSSSKLDQLRRQGKLPSVKIGKAVRFRMSDLQEIVKNGVV